MEDSKLMRVHDRNLNGKRSGMALPMALLIVLVGSILIASIFDVFDVLSKVSVQQRQAYEEHAEMTGLLERAKGALSVYMRNNHRPLHPDHWYDGPNPVTAKLKTSTLIVSSINDLRITTSHLSLTTPENVGGGRAVTEIFDISYTAEEAAGAPIAEKALLPAPLSLEAILMGRVLSRSSLMDIDLVDIGTREGLTDINKPGDETQLVGTNREAYGAYLIRISFFKEQNHGVFETTASHVIDQAFFQVVSSDMFP